MVEVWNNTPDYVFIASGTSLAADPEAGDPIYYIPPSEDLKGPPLDADFAQVNTGITKHFGERDKPWEAARSGADAPS